MLAVGCGHPGVAKILLARREMLVNAVNNQGHSALMLASHGGHKDVVEQLLAVNGMDINLATPTGKTAIKIAAKRGDEAIVHMLLHVAGIQTKTRDTDDGRHLRWREVTMRFLSY